MAMEITSVLQQSTGTQRADVVAAQAAQAEASRKQAAAETQQQVELSRREMERFVQELETVTAAFNKRLSFSYHEDLQQMVVKVIDQRTDTVIKELPPAELRRVHLRIREAIGLLLDESA